MDWSALIAWFANQIQRLPQSDLFGTVVAGAFGAAAGALTAQAVIRRGQTKQAVVAELNMVRAALVLCFAIANQFMTLKRQIVRPMRNKYVQVQQEHEEFQEAAKTHAGPQPLVFVLAADFQTITPMRVPDAILERYVFERISIPGRALAAAVQLAGAIDGLAKSIAYRNDLIAEFQRASPVTPDVLAEKYLGLQRADGVVDEKYKGSLDAIVAQTDDCIFFSRVLADDLLEYGNRLRRRYAWRFRLRVPKLRGADWAIAESAGLIPPTEQYADWLRGFLKPRS